MSRNENYIYFYMLIIYTTSYLWEYRLNFYKLHIKQPILHLLYNVQFRSLCNSCNRNSISCLGENIEDGQNLQLCVNLFISWDFKFSRLWVKMAIFWDVEPWSLLEVCWRFKGAYYLHLQGCEQLPRRHLLLSIYVKKLNI